MAITVTRIGEVFKKTVQDSIDYPTIWIDSRTGKECEDFKYTYIESKDPEIYSLNDISNESSRVVHRADGNDILYIYGPIKQVGSHVISCGRLYYNSTGQYPFLDQLDQIFKYARNLEYASDLFSYMRCDTFSVPKNLFWGCHKLKELVNIFSGTELEYIPAELLSKCYQLESVMELCYYTRLKEIPEDLFKNNPKITNFVRAFFGTSVQKIPNKLLEPFKDGILSKELSFGSFVGNTPIRHCISRIDSDKSKQEREVIRSQYIPTYIPREIQWEMLGYQGSVKDNF